jgi:hypothetical protein
MLKGIDLLLKNSKRERFEVGRSNALKVVRNSNENYSPITKNNKCEIIGGDTMAQQTIELYHHHHHLLSLSFSHSLRENPSTPNINIFSHLLNCFS